MNFRSMASRWTKDPRVAVRAALGVLLLANLMAAAAVFRPWGGSPEDLQRQLTQLRAEAQQREATIERLRTLVSTVEKTRAEADEFLGQYFLDRRTAYSAIVSELTTLAQEAGIKPRGDSYVAEPIEGSETLDMMTITAHYEGTYADLIEFVNLIDRSPRFLTVDALQAAPQQGTGMLNVSLQLNAFLRAEGERQ